MHHRLNLALLGGVAALALAGCRDNAPAAPEPLFVPASNAPAYNLPPPPEAIAAPVADYSYAERAYALDRAFYDAPPDYGFAYMDEEPWAWRSVDGYEMYAEPIDDGYLYYYYEPGAEYPFFVRAPDYSYGYDPFGVVTVVYSSVGVIVPYVHRERVVDYPGLYWTRARDLRVAAHRHHAPVVRETWLARRPALVASQRPWMKAAVEHRDWRRYREQDRDREIRRFDRERERRVEIARRGHDAVRPVQVRQDANRGRPLFENPRNEPPRRVERDERQARVERPDRRLERSNHPERQVERRTERSQPVERAQRVERPRPQAEAPRRTAKAEAPRREVARSERPSSAAPVERKPSRQEARPQRVERPERAARPQPVARERQPQRAERPVQAQRAVQAERRETRQVAARQERQVRPDKAQARGGGRPRQEARADKGGHGRSDHAERGRN